MKKLICKKHKHKPNRFCLTCAIVRTENLPHRVCQKPMGQGKQQRRFRKGSKGG